MLNLNENKVIYFQLNCFSNFLSLITVSVLWLRFFPSFLLEAIKCGSGSKTLCPVLRIRIRCFLPPGSGIRIRDAFIPDNNSLYTKIGRIRDPVLFYPPDLGFGMEQWSDPDPG
jgi:hypothetical protein